MTARFAMHEPVFLYAKLKFHDLERRMRIANGLATGKSVEWAEEQVAEHMAPYKLEAEQARGRVQADLVHAFVERQSYVLWPVVEHTMKQPFKRLVIR
jgi:hypothetical protein